MMDSFIKIVTRNLRTDFDDIARNLISVFRLKYSKDRDDLSGPLFRWIDFRLRYIDPKPRDIFISNRFPKEMPKRCKKAFKLLLEKIRKGEDINPYQSKGLIYYHDTSGHKSQNRTDLLWADWGIAHFHLTTKPVPNSTYFSIRSEWLLFAIVGPDFFAVIDIRNHNEEHLFAQMDLLKIIKDSWPEMIEDYNLRGIHSPDTTSSPEEIKALRISGITTPLSLGERIYAPPGGGLTSATTSTKVTRVVNKVVRHIFDLSCLLCAPDNEMLKKAFSKGILFPRYELIIMKAGISIYERQIKKSWVLPRVRPEINRNSMYYSLAELNDLVAPKWAIKKLPLLYHHSVTQIKTAPYSEI